MATECDGKEQVFFGRAMFALLIFTATLQQIDHAQGATIRNESPLVGILKGETFWAILNEFSLTTNR